jgi:hypothetical protein
VCVCVVSAVVKVEVVVVGRLFLFISFLF